MKTETTLSPCASLLPYRCAVYFAPPVGSEWWEAGSQWLGRCAATGRTMRAPTCSAIDPANFSALTAEPRRYGWHATLKAPFQLAVGQSVQTLLTCLHKLGEGLSAFTLPRLQVSTQGGFLALRPEGDASAIQSVASACVTALHPLAEPLNEAELARRRRTLLTPEQDRLLVAWGYPWVMEHFQFHLSLTGPLEQLAPDQRAAIVQLAQRHFEDLPPCRFEHLALFTEPTAGADFVLTARVGLSA